MEDKQEQRMNALTERVIGCAYSVSNVLGCGFLEKVYENALFHEMVKSGLKVRRQCPINVWYDGIVVGEYVADIIVEDQVLLELKAVRAFDDVHKAQVLNYLRATRLTIALINFGTPRIEIKRFRL